MLDSILSVAAPLVAGWLGQEGQENTNVANAEQAQRQMDFQERMSNTSYQRAVTDLKAAGLNPMLAYSRGGASTPGGAMAAMGNPMEAGMSSAARVAQVAPQVQLTKAQVANTEADTALKTSQALVNAAQVPHLQAQTRQQTHSGSQLEQLARRLLEENDRGWSTFSTSRLREQFQREASEASLSSQRANEGFTQAQIAEFRARARELSARALLQELGEPRARNLANAQGDWWMQGVSPYLDDVQKITNSAGNLSRLIPWQRLMPFRFQ